MKGKLLRSLSANTFHLAINQLFGFLVVNILSVYLSKTEFGQLNLALAFLLAVFVILSFGIDQLVVKKMAAGLDVQQTLSGYIFHTLFSGIAFYALAISCYFLLPSLHPVFIIFLLLSIGKFMIFLSSPFKQAANGMENFKLLAYMSVISNVVRGCMLLLVLWLDLITLTNVILIFIFSDVLELLAGIYLFIAATRIHLKVKWERTAYFQLLKESLPQAGVVVMTAVLARFDWIIIGLLISAESLAEYSFAYKVFELSTFPLLILAPLLLPRFTSWLKQGKYPEETLSLLIRIEMVIAIFSALILVMAWVPVIDWLTIGKYGYVNAHTILILSLCIPVIYMNNFLWSMYFAEGRLKLIFQVFLTTFLINIILNLVLVPLYKNEGAALAFLIAGMAQAIIFLFKNNVKVPGKGVTVFFICSGCAILGGLSAKFFIKNDLMTIFIAALVYIILLVLTRQIRPDDYGKISKILAG